jgi:ATP-binding cassette subfamily B multidrug efflux pump
LLARDGAYARLYAAQFSGAAQDLDEEGAALAGPSAGGAMMAVAGRMAPRE